MRPLDAQNDPATDLLLEYFEYEHLPEPLQAVSMSFHDLAHATVDGLPPGPEITECLRNLLYAKDWAVRKAVSALRQSSTT